MILLGLSGIVIYIVSDIGSYPGFILLFCSAIAIIASIFTLADIHDEILIHVSKDVSDLGIRYSIRKDTDKLNDPYYGKDLEEYSSPRYFSLEEVTELLPKLYEKYVFASIDRDLKSKWFKFRNNILLLNKISSEEHKGSKYEFDEYMTSFILGNIKIHKVYKSDQYTMTKDQLKSRLDEFEKKLFSKVNKDGSRIREFYHNFNIKKYVR